MSQRTNLTCYSWENNSGEWHIVSCYQNNGPQLLLTEGPSPLLASMYLSSIVWGRWQGSQCLYSWISIARDSLSKESPQRGSPEATSLPRTPVQGNKCLPPTFQPSGIKSPWKIHNRVQHIFKDPKPSLLKNRGGTLWLYSLLTLVSSPLLPSLPKQLCQALRN